MAIKSIITYSNPIFFIKIKKNILLVLIFIFGTNVFSQEIISITDNITNQNSNYQRILKKNDGNLISDKDVDGVLIYKKNNLYYKKIYEGYINVKWFGAIGNGIADDTKAIQKAIDVVYNNNKPINMTGGWLLGSGVIYFPSGTYNINSSLIIKDNISLLGENKNSVRINSSVPTAITNIEGTAISPTKMNYAISIENLFLTGGGIELQGASKSQIKNVNIFNTPSGSGIILRLTTALYLDQIQVFNCLRGISIEGSAGKGPSTTIDINRLWVAHCAKEGVKIISYPNELISSKISNSIFEYNEKGVVLSGRNEISFNNIHFEQNSVASMEVYDQATLNLEDLWCDVGNITFFNSSISYKNQISLKNIVAPVVVQNGFKGTIFVEGNVNLQKLPNAGEKVYFLKGNQGNSTQRPIDPQIGYSFYDIDLKKPVWWDGKNWSDALGNKIK